MGRTEKIEKAMYLRDIFYKILLDEGVGKTAARTAAELCYSAVFKYLREIFDDDLK